MPSIKILDKEFVPYLSEQTIQEKISELAILLNKDYDERMNIDVINFITDENLTKGRKIITSVIKPQVNFNGVLIQRAQVDVSQN